MTVNSGTAWAGALLQIIAMAALASAVLSNTISSEGSKKRSALSSTRDGFLFGLAWFTVGVGWVYISMHRYGGMHSALAGAATLIFAAYLALYPAIACLIAHAWQFGNQKSQSNWSSLRFIAGFASAMTLLELARGYFFTGFPWISPGYAHVDSPLSSIAPWGGVYAITWVSCACAAALAWIAVSTGTAAVRMALPMIVLVASLTLPKWLQSDASVPTNQALTVTLIQGNVNQAMKFDAGQVIGNIRMYLDQIEANLPVATKANESAHLFVLPETAWPTSLGNMPDEIKDRFDRITSSGQIKVAIGAPFWHSPERTKSPSISNSVIVMGQKGSENYRYDKQHLVPFGEFIPSGFQWFLDIMQMPLGAFKRGDPNQPYFAIQDQKIAFNICYEDLFGEELANQTQQANLLINLSNIAWFDDSKALDQHLQIARMRVLEIRKPMLRATNTGATVVIDADGSVRNALPWITRGIITTSIKGAVGTTPYARWTNTPIAVACGFVALILSAMAFALRRRYA